MSDKYAALADTIKIEDITSNDANQNILLCLKDNDPGFDKLYMNKGNIDNDDTVYTLKDGEDIGWLGYYIGNNTKLQELHFSVAIKDESFYKEMIRNRSIQKIHFFNVNLLDQLVFFMLGPFFKNNSNLIGIEVRDCDLGANDIHQLSLAIGGCKESLKSFELSYNVIEDDVNNMVDIITSLSMHPQLTKLRLLDMIIGRNECMALATLLRCTTTQLRLLNLNINDIDDEGVEALVNSLSNVNQLQELNLSANREITINGWKKVATLLEMPSSNIELLDVSYNEIRDEEARIFANALKNNSTLKTLNLKECYFSLGQGWVPFSKLLCDTSSISNTYLSNHILWSIGDSRRPLPDDIRSYLELNKNKDRQKVAMAKILRAHSHFDMHPFFEWEFKVLPIMMDWFTKASTRTTSFEEKIKKLKLAAVYDFIREFPMLYIEPMTKQELIEYSAMEITLRGSRMQHASILEEVQRCKTRALMRL